MEALIGNVSSAKTGAKRMRTRDIFDKEIGRRALKFVAPRTRQLENRSCLVAKGLPNLRPAIGCSERVTG
jgi:hypothetical protein